MIVQQGSHKRGPEKNAERNLATVTWTTLVRGCETQNVAKEVIGYLLLVPRNLWVDMGKNGLRYWSCRSPPSGSVMAQASDCTEGPVPGQRCSPL